MKTVIINGKEYPLNCSVKAIREIMGNEKAWGTVNGNFDESDPKAVVDSFDSLVFILSVLLQQGAAYKRIFEGEEVKAPNREDLEVLLSPADMADCQESIMAALQEGMERNIEVKAPKNGKAAQRRTPAKASPGSSSGAAS